MTNVTLLYVTSVTCLSRIHFIDSYEQKYSLRWSRVEFLLANYGGSYYLKEVIEPETVVDGEWIEWYRLSPLERWHETANLWIHYLQIGGTLDPEPDPESPFYDGAKPSPGPLDGRAGMRVLRRSGI